MRRAGVLVAAMVAAFALCACDEPGSASKDKTSAFDPTAEENIPPPARFAKPGPPEAPATRQLIAAAPAAPSPVTESHETVAWNQAMAFDGAPPLPSAPVARSPGVKRNSPVPDSTQGKAVVLADRQMAIDTDGEIRDPARRASVVAHDRWHQDGTALNVAGRSLDSTVVPYVSVPKGFGYAKPGDLVQVAYNGRTRWAVVGDVGPRGRFGEGSVALAQRLGIPSDGTSGGVWSGVTYTFPGRRAPLVSQASLVAYLGSLDDQTPIVVAGN